MALVHEETRHEYLDAEIMVSQRQRGEVIEDWAICHLEVDSMRRRSPDELVELGEWLIVQGKRIKSAYRKNGAARTAGVPPFDATKVCVLDSDDPTRTECPRCKNPHHKCDGRAAPQSIGNAGVPQRVAGGDADVSRNGEA